MNDGYRVIQVNREKWRVYHDSDVIGHARMGTDGKWYPELYPPSHGHLAAEQRVILAHIALGEFQHALDA